MKSEKEALETPDRSTQTLVPGAQQRTLKSESEFLSFDLKIEQKQKLLREKERVCV